MDNRTFAEEARRFDEQSQRIGENKKDELLVLLDEARKEINSEDGALTSRQISELKGWSDKKTTKRLRLLLDADLIETIKVERMNIAGFLSKVPAYLIKNPDLDL